MPRQGFAVPMVLGVLVVVALAAAGAAWGAWAIASADRAAAAAWGRWALADSLVRRWACRDGGMPGLVEQLDTVRDSVAVRVRVRYATGACVVSVAVGDTLPLVEGVLTVQNRGVTPEANTAPLALPSIDAVAELPARSLATVPGPVVSAGSVRLAWRDLR